MIIFSHKKAYELILVKFSSVKFKISFLKLRQKEKSLMNSNYLYFHRNPDSFTQISQLSDSSDSSYLPTLTYEESHRKFDKSDITHSHQKQIPSGVLNLSQKNIKVIKDSSLSKVSKDTSQLELEEGITALNLSKNNISELGKLPNSIEGLNVSENK